jgi:Insect allergen related repeat, nitrile-specifier detoxification
MKLLAICAILMASGVSVNSDMPLGEAMIRLREVLRLAEWAGAWNVLRNSDYQVCGFSNELNTYYPAAFASIEVDPLYNELRDYMVAGGVPWDQFVAGELKPAVGVHAIVSPCTTLSNGGVAGLRSRLLSYFDLALVDRTINELRAASTSFNALHVSIEGNQAGVHRMRCHPDVDKIYQIMSSQSVDFTFIFEVISIIFGWGDVVAC